MRERMRERLAKLDQQFEAVTLTINDPWHDEAPRRFVQCPVVLRNASPTPRRRVSSGRRIPMRIAEIDEIDPASRIIGLFMQEVKPLD